MSWRFRVRTWAAWRWLSRRIFFCALRLVQRLYLDCITTYQDCTVASYDVCALFVSYRIVSYRIVRFVELLFQWMEYLIFMGIRPENFGRISRKLHDCLFEICVYIYTHTHTHTLSLVRWSSVTCVINGFYMLRIRGFLIVKIIINNYGTRFTSHVGVSGMWHILWNILWCKYQNTRF